MTTFHVGILCLSGALLAAQIIEPTSGDILLGVANFETVAVTGSGEGHHTPNIVVRTTSQTNKIESFGISNDVGMLLEPFPPGEYCYDAFSSAGRRLQMMRPAVERCFNIRVGEITIVGVEVQEETLPLP